MALMYAIYKVYSKVGTRPNATPSPCVPSTCRDGSSGGFFRAVGDTIRLQVSCVEIKLLSLRTGKMGTELLGRHHRTLLFRRKLKVITIAVTRIR